MTKVASVSVSSPPSEASSVTLDVLGRFDLRDNENQPIELKARKSRFLLVYLAVPPGQLRSREQLASLLWCDRQEEQARASLRNALSGIRRAIGVSAFDTQDGTFTDILPCAHSILGQVEEAFVQLEKTLGLGCSKIKVHFMIVTGPDLVLVRKNPHFKKLTKGYWQNEHLLGKPPSKSCGNFYPNQIRLTSRSACSRCAAFSLWWP